MSAGFLSLLFCMLHYQNWRDGHGFRMKRKLLVFTHKLKCLY